MNRKRLKLIKHFLISFFGILLILHANWYQLLPSEDISSTELQTLEENGEKAIETLDVPVAAIIKYKGQIIGEGYNTVNRDHNAGGHAEINAISSVLEHMGYAKFSKLDRDSLQLISTYEPCLMCQGAIQHYNIKHVLFLKEKTVKKHLSYYYKDLKYSWFKRKVRQDTLQEYLFKKHPNYKSE